MIGAMPHFSKMLIPLVSRSWRRHLSSASRARRIEFQRIDYRHNSSWSPRHGNRESPPAPHREVQKPADATRQSARANVPDSDGDRPGRLPDLGPAATHGPRVHGLALFVGGRGCLRRVSMPAGDLDACASPPPGGPAILILRPAHRWLLL